MYNKILVTLDTTSTDRAIIEHIKALATIMLSHVMLLHVADGWAARMYGADAVSPEVTQDKPTWRRSLTNSRLKAYLLMRLWHMATRPAKSSDGFATRDATWWR
jgi:hypothetical protein